MNIYQRIILFLGGIALAFVLVTAFGRHASMALYPLEKIGNPERFLLSLKCGSIIGTTYGQICRNGVAVGSEWSTTSTNWVAFTEDISRWSAGDLCQLYIKKGISDTQAQARRFSVCVGPGPYAGVILTQN